MKANYLRRNLYIYKKKKKGRNQKRKIREIKLWRKQKKDDAIHFRTKYKKILCMYIYKQTFIHEVK